MRQLAGTIVLVGRIRKSVLHAALVSYLSRVASGRAWGDENVGLCEFRGLPTFLSTFSAGAWPSFAWPSFAWPSFAWPSFAWPSFVCWPKAFFHRSLGQRPRNGCPRRRFWPKAMFIFGRFPFHLLNKLDRRMHLSHVEQNVNVIGDSS